MKSKMHLCGYSPSRDERAFACCARADAESLTPSARAGCRSALRIGSIRLQLELYSAVEQMKQWQKIAEKHMRENDRLYEDKVCARTHARPRVEAIVAGRGCVRACGCRSALPARTCHGWVEVNGVARWDPAAARAGGMRESPSVTD
jgi:hypothetical protein